MVKLSLFFDRSDHRYSSGDTIELEVRVQVNSEQKYRSIYTKVHGYGHVEWTESRSVTRDGKTQTEYTTYSSDETFFQQYQTLTGAKKGPEIRLPVGTHVYHARLALPPSLPENHENQYGHIRYEVEVHMDGKSDFNEKLSFFINPRLDLNEFPQLREPVRAVADKTFGFCCWRSKPLKICNTLPRSGFVPGESVQYSLEINNESNVVINSAEVKLMERITYHAHSPSSEIRENKRALWSHEFTGNNRQLVAALQNKIFTTEIHFKPTYDFHFFTGCGNIVVEYYLESTAINGGCHTNLSNQTKIFMGTIPFGNYSNGVHPTMPSPSALPTDKPISEQPLPLYNDKQLKTGMVPGIGWAGTNIPTPAFTDIVSDDKKEDKKEKQ